MLRLVQSHASLHVTMPTVSNLNSFYNILLTHSRRKFQYYRCYPTKTKTVALLRSTTVYRAHGTLCTCNGTRYSCVYRVREVKVATRTRTQKVSVYARIPYTRTGIILHWCELSWSVLCRKRHYNTLRDIVPCTLMLVILRDIIIIIIISLIHCITLCPRAHCPLPTAAQNKNGF